MGNIMSIVSKFNSGINELVNNGVIIIDKYDNEFGLVKVVYNTDDNELEYFTREIAVDYQYPVETRQLVAKLDMASDVLTDYLKTLVDLGAYVLCPNDSDYFIESIEYNNGKLEFNTESITIWEARL